MITSNVSEQPQLILDDKATAQAQAQHGPLARVIDVEATVNKNALAIDSHMDSGVNVIKFGWKGFSLFEAYEVTRAMPQALEATLEFDGQRLQKLCGIGLIDSSRVLDVAFTHAGAAVDLELAVDLARQGETLSVSRSAEPRTLSDMNSFAAASYAAEDPAEAEAQRARANEISKHDAFVKAKAELLIAHLAGLPIFLLDTQNKDVGFNRFVDFFSDAQLVELADMAHEMGMDIWGAGSLKAEGYERLVKAGWNLVCFGGAARTDSGIRDELAVIDPARVKRLRWRDRRPSAHRKRRTRARR